MNYLYDCIQNKNTTSINIDSDSDDNELLILKLRTENIKLRQMVKHLLEIIEENENSTTTFNDEYPLEDEFCSNSK